VCQSKLLEIKVVMYYFIYYIRTLSKPRRRRQGESHQTKVLMSKTMAVHVRYKSLYISLPSSANQQREKTKFCAVWGMQTTTSNLWFPCGIERCHYIFSLSTILEPLAYWKDLDNCEFCWWNINSFLTRHCPRRRRCLSSLSRFVVRPCPPSFSFAEIYWERAIYR